MLRLYRPETIENEKRTAIQLRGCQAQVERPSALTPRLVGPEVNAALSR